MINREVRTRESISSAKYLSMIRNLGIGFLAAVVTGSISGLLLRLSMKVIALVFPQMAGGFSIEGTLLLVVVGIGFSLANSIVYSLFQRLFPIGWIRKGLIYGILNLFIFGTPFFLSNPNNELFGPQAPLGIGLFTILFLIGSLLLAMFVESITTWVEQSKNRRIYPYIFFAILVVPAIAMSGGIIYEIVYELIPAIQANF